MGTRDSIPVFAELGNIIFRDCNKSATVELGEHIFAFSQSNAHLLGVSAIERNEIYS